ncbi:MAG TPA: aminotransferase class I/II-fold pyridoxal phosphate-dependent enzyme [Candidatus Latescibacteria bacterium]|nr:aminotransferase class I/II-fold pyridoxal phosphate-dependent enzyme [Candidatus Latescibacterota bacterium]
MKNTNDGFVGESTRSVHGGEERNKFAQSLINPIAQTATFTFNNLDEFEAFKSGEKNLYEYGRYGNPTQRVAECKIASLENAEEALLFSSGMSAITSVLYAMLRSGQHLIIMEDCYRMTAKFCRSLAKFGIETTLVKPGDMGALAEAVRPETRLIFTESPTNPHLHVLDLEKLVDFAKERRLKVLIDSTLATPINQRPLDFGVDLVIHSATKYMGGHNDLMAGVVCGKGALIDAIREYQRITGSVADPNTSYLLIRGLKTLALRVARQNDTAMQIAQFLEEHPTVTKVYYPGLESHVDHKVAKAQMRGFGGLISFEIEGNLERTRDFVHRLSLPYLAPSLGGVETLVSHPATVSYYDLSPEERLSIGITDQLVRYAVGIEDAQELVDDIEQALAGV